MDCLKTAKIKVDKELCIGCGACTSSYPELFEMGEDMKSRVKKKEVYGDEKHKAEEAVDICPVGAISVE